MSAYKDRIVSLAEDVNDAIDVDLFQDKETDVTPPTMAFSQFLINKEQGDWAEGLMKEYLTSSTRLEALEYGRSEDKIAGEPGFAEFYKNYHEELATIGKCPDLLVFPEGEPNDDLARKIEDIEGVPRGELIDDISDAVAGLEVRSSAYMVNKHRNHHQSRIATANEEVRAYLDEFDELVAELRPHSLEDRSRMDAFVDEVRQYANATSKDEAPRFRVSTKIQRMAENLPDGKVERFLELPYLIRDTKKETFGRNTLSITAKVEDFVVILNWIRTHDVPHYYVQVFFDSVYIISFEEILELLASPDANSSSFTFEKNEKNQMKYTVHIDVDEATKIADDMPFPETAAAQRVFDDGRVQNYVTFHTSPDTFELASLAPTELERLLSQ